MNILVAVLMGAAARADINGAKWQLYDGVLSVNGVAVGTVEMEPVGQKYLATMRVDGRKALRTLGMSSAEAAEADLPPWADSQLWLAEVWQHSDGDGSWIIAQPTGSAAMRISLGYVEVCVCSSNGRASADCDPNDCTGSTCTIGDEGFACEWRRGGDDGCGATMPLGMVVPMLLACALMRRLGH